jgi:hypothetical protein
MKPQVTDTVVMVRPVDFTYNEQTAVDNHFQNRPNDIGSATQKALQEFANMVDKLTVAGINVLVLEVDSRRSNPQFSDYSFTITPDAVFPNNWFSTNTEGELLVYPMYTENRRAERRVEDLTKLFIERGYQVKGFQWIADSDKGEGESDQILEGTGAIVIDHLQQRLYATESERCNREKYAQFAKDQNYQSSYLFQTQCPQGNPIYHTNVMMSIGEKFAVICNECFVDNEQYTEVKQNLQIQREVIEISCQQMSDHFCGNILELRNDKGESVIVMSQSAFNGFSELQRRQLAQYGQLLPCDIKTIESIGGGSARCMIAEVFLPKSHENRRELEVVTNSRSL